MHGAREKFVLLLVLVFAFVSVARAEVGGKITGVVKDQTGSVIAGAVVVVTNTQTGVKLTTTTDQDGVFTFPVLSVGQYQIDVTSDAFKPYRKTNLAIDINSALVVDVMVEVKEQDQSIMVTEDAAQVETTDTQLGQVLGTKKVTEMPLNGRSYTDLLAIQPGVAPVSTLLPSSVIMTGVTGSIDPSGDANPGNLSINGQRESSNGFMVNGIDVQEHMNGGTSIIPDLDSIDEFRVLTNNFDPEYGNYNGGVVTVVSKAGSNAFHGGAFEFFRNTTLDARGYFDPTRSAFRQNQ